MINVRQQTGADMAARSQTPLQHISASRTTAVPGQQILREGGSVFIRVISGSGNGVYTVSLGGRQFSARSEQPLESGTVLKVQIQQQEGKILLIPETFPAPDTGLLRFDRALLENTSLPAQFSALFSALGIPADQISVQLLVFLQQAGMKADIQKLNLCRTIARQFPGHEAEAAEAAIALWEKGIKPDADITAALLNLLLLNGQQHGAGVDDDDGSRERSGTGSEDTSAAPFDGLYNCRLLSLAREPGLLTLFNHISGGTRHWIILPFTFPSETEEIVGNIRVLLNREKKNTEKVVLSAESSVFKYSFVLYYNKNRILSGAFSIVPEPLPSVVQQITVTLQNLCDGGTVIFNPYGSYSLWDANPEDITAVDTEV